MLHSKRIHNSLKIIDQEYEKSMIKSDRLVPVMYSKLAIVELCGWIEEGFDEIARNSVRRKLRTKASRRLLEKKIKRTHGFEYDSNAQQLIGFALGTVRLIELEKKLERKGRLTELKAQLSELHSQRNLATHNYIRGTTLTLQAPSTTLNRFEKIYPILEDYWERVKSM